MSELYGVMAEFAAADAVRAAARAAVRAGYRALDAYSPYPVEDLADDLGFRPRLAAVAFVAGVLGGAAIFAFAGWAQAIDWTDVRTTPPQTSPADARSPSPPTSSRPSS